MALNNRTLAAGAALILVGALGPAAASPPQRSAERGVRRALIRLNTLLAARDPALIGEFAKGEETILIGSTATDIARGRAAIEAHIAGVLAAPETLSFSWRQVEVVVRGTLAMLHAEGEAVFKDEAGERRVPYRLTGVLEPDGGRWKWRLFHGSQPATA
jgi:ketosteroid isomerase-like protein